MTFTLHELAQMDRLRRLHDTGWRFQPQHEDGELHELVYSQRRGEWLDVIRVRSVTDAEAGRFEVASVLSGRPRACWSTDGTLGDVLDALARFRVS